MQQCRTVLRLLRLPPRPLLLELPLKPREKLRRVLPLPPRLLVVGAVVRLAVESADLPAKQCVVVAEAGKLMIME
jgi:hypothetical protein